MSEKNGDAKLKNDIKVLGQVINYPRDVPGTVSFAIFIFAAAIVLCVLIIYGKYYTPSQIAAMKKMCSVSFTKGEVVGDTVTLESEDGYSFGFWTPSTETKNGMGSYVNDKDYKWQVIDNEKINNDFGKKLIENLGIQGYRRYKVLGEGNKPLKEGWWWTVGEKGKPSKDFLKRFVKTYKDHWKTPENVSIRIEVSSLFPIDEK
jgi:hypothetical protein